MNSLSWRIRGLRQLNRLFAVGKFDGHYEALQEAEKLTGSKSSNYYQLLGYLYGEHDTDQPIYYYEKAVSLIKSNSPKVPY